MTPDDRTQWRIEQLETQVAKLGELASRFSSADTELRQHDDELNALQEELREQRREIAATITSLRGDHTADMKSLRDGQRTLILVLIGFAFSVAGSAVTLALALGGPS